MSVTVAFRTQAVGHPQARKKSEKRSATFKGGKTVQIKGVNLVKCFVYQEMKLQEISEIVV